MNPEQLTARNFDGYPPQARAFAVSHLQELKRLPLPVLASFLDRIIGWDWRFPSERDQLAAELENLATLGPDKFRQLIQPLASISLPAELRALDWVNSPHPFLERLSAHLWSSQQIDGYRAAAQALVAALSVSRRGSAPKQRLVIVTCAEDLVAVDYPLFSKLRAHGLYATNVDGHGADGCITRILSSRSNPASSPYAHWFVDGGKARSGDLQLGTSIYLSYERVEPVRVSVVKIMRQAVTSGWGPELLRSRLMQLTPADCHADTVTGDPVLQRFIVDLFANGSGTQIYTTSFVQWSAREILRRAQPETLGVRVTARERQHTLNEFISGESAPTQVDCAGSLIDGDLAAYYTWLELQKLSGAETSVFLAWFAGHRQALLIGPGVPKNVSTANRLILDQVLGFAEIT